MGLKLTSHIRLSPIKLVIFCVTGGALVKKYDWRRRLRGGVSGH